LCGADTVVRVRCCSQIARFQDCRTQARSPSPGGATELSPALQRWEKWNKRIKSRRDDRVLTWRCRSPLRDSDHLLTSSPALNSLREKSASHLILGGAAVHRCGKCIVLSPALAAEGTALAHGRLFPQALKRWAKFGRPPGWNLETFRVAGRPKRRSQRAHRSYPFAFFTSSISAGTMSNKFPTMAQSAISKIGASESLLIATMLFEPFMPTRCWIAPEIPSAR
jgi:hypothetical protein